MLVYHPGQVDEKIVRLMNNTLGQQTHLPSGANLGVLGSVTTTIVPVRRRRITR